MQTFSYLGPKSRISDALGSEPFEEPLKELPSVDIIVVYRYRHIIPWRLLKPYHGRIINVHTSLLPWQRGAYPVFWAFMEGTGHGVTIHEIDRGIDTGPIIAQLPVVLDPEKNTFESAWTTINQVAQDFFIALWPQLLDVTPQLQPVSEGSHHYKEELMRYGDPFPWNSLVSTWLDDQAMQECSEDFWDKYRAEIRDLKS